MIRSLLYLLVTIALICSSSAVQAQHTHSHDGKEHIHHNHSQTTPQGYFNHHRHPASIRHEDYDIKNRMLQNRRDKVALLQAFDKSRGNDSTVYVPIQFHISTKADGFGAASIDDILGNLCKLNDDFQFLNIEFYLAGPMLYIAQDAVYDDGLDPLALWYMQMYKQPNVVNVYVGNAVNSSGSAGTILGFYTSNLDIIYLTKNSVGPTKGTLTHEMGHLLSLPHPFFGWEDYVYDVPVGGAPPNGSIQIMSAAVTRTPSILPNGVEVEKLVRSGGEENCQIAADGFCDTDANYGFGLRGGTYNNGCTYAGTAHDPTGVLFIPASVGSTASRFVLEEGDNALSSMRLVNASTKNLVLHGQTLVVVETKFTNAGNTTTMWTDTIGDTDSTDFYVGGPGSDDIIEGTTVDVAEGFINTANYTLDVNVSSGSSDLSFIAPAASFAVQGTDHTTTMDSLRVTNNSAINTIAASTVITLQEVFKNGSTTVNSETWTRALPNALAPGESYTFNFIAETKSTAGGVIFEVATYAPVQNVIDPESDNIMSYYQDACVNSFTSEQGEAMKIDIAARGFATLYSTPNDITLTNPVTPINPMAGAVSPSPTVHFQWNPVNGATMYLVRIFEMNVVLGIPLAGGFSTERMTTSTDFWYTLPLAGAASKNYGWSITPLNAVSFCDPTTNTGIMTFDINDWAVGLRAVDKNILSTRLYPNPSKSGEEAVVEIKALTNSQADITVSNSVGQIVSTISAVAIQSGINTQRLNTANLTAGLYIVTVKTSEGVSSHKLVIEE